MVPWTPGRRLRQGILQWHHWDSGVLLFCLVLVYYYYYYCYYYHYDFTVMPFCKMDPSSCFVAEICRIIVWNTWSATVILRWPTNNLVHCTRLLLPVRVLSRHRHDDIRQKSVCSRCISRRASRVHVDLQGGPASGPSPLPTYEYYYIIFKINLPMGLDFSTKSVIDVRVPSLLA